MASAAGIPVEGEGQVECVRPRLGDLRSHITCVLCAGYFIDATTIVECMHTFCRSCILRHLEASSYCPVCDVMIHRTKGSSSLRADRILQTMVYKLVPGLFSEEMRKRRDFYEWKPYADPELPGWVKGDVASYVPHVFTADEHVHVRLELFNANRSEEGSTEQPGTGPSVDVPPVRYLRCQAGTPITVLQKFVRAKFQISPSLQVQLIYGHYVLPDDISLMDLGYLYRPPQDSPVRLKYRFVKKRVAASEATAASEPAAKRPRTDEEPRRPVVLLERMFDADDEEPTSPKEVADIIASLDAEETPRPGTPRPSPVTSPAADAGVGDEEDAVPSSSAGLDAQFSTEGGGECSADRDTGAAGDTHGLSHDMCEISDQRCTTSDEECEAGGVKCAASSGVADAVGETAQLSDKARGDTLAVDCGDVATGSDSMTTETGADSRGENVPSSHSRQEKVSSSQSQQEEASSSTSQKEEASSSGLATDADVGSSSETDLVESMSERLVSANQEAESKPSHPETELVCDDVASECDLVVDEEVSAVSPDTMVASVKDPPDGESLSCHAVAHQESDDGATESDMRTEAVGTSNEASRDSLVMVTSIGIVCGAEGKSVTSDPGFDSTVVTQTAPFCGSGAPEHSVSETSNAFGDLPSDVPEAVVAGSGSSEAPSKDSESRSGPPSTSSVSCGTRDIDVPSQERPREPPTTVDCSVQTVPTAPVKRAHKRPVLPGGTVNKPPRESAAIPKQTPVHRSEPRATGVGNHEHGSGQSNAVKTLCMKVPQPFKKNISKVMQPELADKLMQSAVRAGDSKHAASPGISKPYGANVLKIPSAVSSNHAFHRLESNNGSVGFTKPVSNKTAKHSPDSSSTPYAKSSADIKHFFKEIPRNPNSVAKYLEKHHKRGLTGSPLDLSTRASKTAADSTSMLSKRARGNPQLRKQKPAKAQGTQTIHSIVKSLSQSQHISLTPIPSESPGRAKSAPQPRRPVPEQQHSTSRVTSPASFPFPSALNPHDFYSSPLHVNTSMASRLGYDMAMRNLLTLSHMAMAQGGMVRPHMFPMQPMFPPRPNSHDYARMPDPSLLRQQSEVRMGAASKKASPTAGTTAPQLRTPTALTSASIQHMEDLTRTVGKRADKERHSVTVTAIPSK